MIPMCHTSNWSQNKSVWVAQYQSHLSVNYLKVINQTGEWLTILPRIQDILGSNIGPETDYPNRIFVLFLSASGKYRDSALS
jgi:hypothetical protein